MKSLLPFFLILITVSGFTQPTQNMTIRTNLYVTTAGVDYLYDGVLTEYFTNFNNNVDNSDAIKLGGDWNTSIGILRNGVTLSVERRDSCHAKDTTFFRNRNYRAPDLNLMLWFTVTNVYPANLVATLHDNYLNTNTPIATNGSITKYYYTVDANPLSTAENRFYTFLANPNAYIAPVIPPVARMGKEFKVYPNPIMTGQKLHIELTDSLYHDFCLISTTGTRYRLNPLKHADEITLPYVPAGVYILYDQKNKLHQKIVVTK